MSEPLPAAVALADQWEAEIMDVARDLAEAKLSEQEISLTSDEIALLEAGYGLGFAATLVVMERNGWLRKP
jgi:hypothetical protein